MLVKHCLLKGIPTHYLKDSEKVDPDRSLLTGRWITKKATIREEFIEQVEIATKVLGTITNFNSAKSYGMVSDDGGGPAIL